MYPTLMHMAVNQVYMHQNRIHYLTNQLNFNLRIETEITNNSVLIKIK